MNQRHKYSSWQISFIRGQRKYLPFFVCLGISATLWFTREMGKNYEEHLSMPVVYENIPLSLSLVSKVPSTISITVEASGWGLLKHYLFEDQSLKVNVGALKDANTLHIETKNPTFLASLGEQLHVLEVFPKEITFAFEPIYSKKVPIKTAIDISYTQQYMLNGEIAFSPDSIILYGSHAELDTISTVVSEPLQMKRVKESFSEKLKITPIRNVRMNSTFTTVKGDVEKFTEQTISIPIKFLNAPSNIVAVDLMVDKVDITYLIGLSNVQKCYPSDFEAVADYEKLSKNGTIPIEIVRFPQYVRIVQQSPMNDGIIVNYIDSKQNE